MQRDRDRTLALDHEPRPPLARFRRDLGDPLHVGLGTGIEREPAVHEVLEPVLPDEDETVDADMLLQEVDRPSAHDADDPEPCRQVAERVEGAGQRDGVVGVVDDRSKGAVEVDDQRCAARVAGERSECVGWSYEPNVTMQSAFAAPSGGGSGYGSTAYPAPSVRARASPSFSNPETHATADPVRCSALPVPAIA